MSGIIEKLTDYVSDYLSTRVIFIVDVILSTLASACVILVGNELVATDLYQGVFVLEWCLLGFGFSVIMFLATNSFRIIIRHMSIKDVLSFGIAVAGKVALMALVIGLHRGIGQIMFVCLMMDFFLSLFILLGVRVLTIVGYNVFRTRLRDREKRRRVLVYGTSEKAVSIITRLKNSPHYNIVGFISSEALEKEFKITALKVFYFPNEEKFLRFAQDNSIYGIIFPTDLDVRSESEGLVGTCNRNGINLLVAPPIGEVMQSPKIREVKIEDLLGRPEIRISLDEIRANLEGKVVMVTGAAGSIGSELVRQIARFGVEKIVLYDNAETPMHNLRLELEENFPDLNFVPVIGDVRLERRLDYAFRRWRPSVVFHAAAYKHVPLMEENPCEAVLVNAVGSHNVADKCIEYDVEKFVMISTDKAVNPTNIMGCTKRLAEIYVQSLGLRLMRDGEVTLANGKTYKARTKFVTTRFGNVLGSNGSVIPRFREQIAKGGPVTVTHPDINRFFMTIPEACRLVMEAATLSKGNQIFVFDMGESVKIDTLARRMIELAGFIPDKDIMIEYTGLRPGEKLYEEVLSTVEGTDPTTHDRIRIARVREYPYEDACEAVGCLESLSRAVDIPEMVKYMKQIVPEFRSNNSPYEIYDVKPAETAEESAK